MTLTVTDNDGATGTNTSVKIILNRAPIAEFTYSPSTPQPDETVTFNATDSYDPDGVIVNYSWDFGDGYTGSGMIVTHAFETEGDYLVTLTVTDNDGENGTRTHTVHVTAVLAPDVAVISVVPSNTTAYPTWAVPLNITVVVENQGPITVTFNVTVYYDSNPIGTKTVTDLGSGAQATLVFEWNLTDVPPSVVSHAYVPYTIKAEAEILPGETDTADNSLTDGTVLVKLPGDATGDGTVDVSDFSFMGYYWFNVRGYNPSVDFNNDGMIDVSDFAILGKYWFESI